jgi:class 3 adenylate cyclase
MVAMVLAVMLVLLASFELIRLRVADYFEATLRDQYAQQFELAEERDAERLSAYATEISNNTSNPRLLAALFEEDLARFYYDLSQELEPFHQTMEERYGTNRAWPFFRFIRQDGRYLTPPEFGDAGVQEATNALPGVLSPFPEERLERLLSGLRTKEDEVPSVRSGFLVAGRDGKPVLLKAFACPVTDAFGMFLGDLILVLPWRSTLGEDEGTVGAVMVEGRIFDGRGRLRSKEWPELADLLAEDGRQDGTRRVLLDGEPYLVFSQILQADQGFVGAKRAILFSTDEQERLLSGIRNVLLGFAFLGFVFSLFLSHVLADGLNAPVLRLREAARRIGGGDFSARVAIRSRDEIGQLGAAFNQMAEGLELKERYKAVLSKVADPRVAERLMQGRINLGGETVRATVLFCDVRGFTRMSEGMDPHEVIAIINAHMTAMTEIVHAYGGVVDKFVGDEIMALFGVPVPVDDDAGQAFRCAREMVARCRETNRHRNPPIEIGIGIAHGEMVAGCMGSEDRLNYTVLGDRVNLASRLCAQAKPMEIVVDEPVRDGAGLEIPDSEQQTIALKGFDTAPSFYIINSE